MDFFEAQARAKQRTTRLVLLFALAVVGTVCAGYLAAVLILAQAGGGGSPWRPELFAFVAACTLLVIGIASFTKWTQFRAGGAAVAESVGARRIDPQAIDLDERRLLNVVEEMAIASGVPLPAVYVLDDEPAINAFAAGLTTSDAVIAVTRGALEKLNRDELQGVVGHEFSHVLNGDMRLNVKLSAILFGILVIGLAGRTILRSMGRGRVHVNRGSGKNKGGGVAFVLAIGLALMIVGYVGYFFGRLIQAAVSRQREFLADASSVQFTRNPAGLSGALRKIGGYALGSSLQTSKGAELGHFFFAQGFRSLFGGAWATHPPLAERIRAIDPRFDGKFYVPETVVNVAEESFESAGFVRRAPSREAAEAAFAAPARIAPPPLPRRIAFQPSQVAANAGTVAPAHLARAQDLLAALPPRLRQAAANPAEAPALVYGLLLGRDPAGRELQVGLVQRLAGDDAAGTLAALRPALSILSEEALLPLAQLSIPALRQLDRPGFERFLGTLDELVHADARVTSFEFALQKTLAHQLQLGLKPQAPENRIHSLSALSRELSIVLSTLASARPEGSAAAASAAFELAAQKLGPLARPLELLHRDALSLEQLDSALDRLALAVPPIKQRILNAAAHAIGADGTVDIEEAELFRAVAASLDVPMPPLTPPTPG